MNRLPALRTARDREGGDPPDPMPVEELLAVTDEEFRERFRGSPIKRAKRSGLLRNAAAGLSVRTDTAAISALEAARIDPDPLVREQVALAMRQHAERASE